MDIKQEKPEQLILDLPHRSAMGEQDFMVSECNKAAVRLIDVWPDWPAHYLLMIGPSGVGKTHLANVWRMKSGAQVLCAEQLLLEKDKVEQIREKQALIIEDIDQVSDDKATFETALFHILNLSKEHDFHVLMTAQERPGMWPVALPDLRSRLRATPFVEIDPPDTLLLNGILVKLFQDRQLHISPQVVQYISMRIERSMDAVQNIIDAIDKAALATGRKVSRQLAGEVIAKGKYKNI
ncbi:MAG: DnaA/Hda family protein [Pseudomonadota bacterium]